VAGAEPDRLRSSLPVGVTLGQSDLPERIRYPHEPQKLPAVLGADEVARFPGAVPSLKSRAADPQHGTEIGLM
jgi:hypothetical protein